MAVIGIGSTSRVTLGDLFAVIAAASDKAKGIMRGTESEGEGLHMIATMDRPSTNGVYREAATTLSIELRLLTLDDLLAFAGGCATHSAKSMKAYGIPSVAEASALAAAGAGAKLVIPRFCGRNTTASVAAAP